MHELGLGLARCRSQSEAGGNHRDAQVVGQSIVVHAAVDDRGVLRGKGADDVHHLLGLAQLEAGARGGDIHQDPARAGQVDALEQRAGNRLLRGDASPVDAARYRRAHHRHALLRHDGAHVLKVDVHQSGQIDDLGDPGDRVIEHVVGRLECVFLRHVLSEHLLELVVEDDDQRIDVRRKFLQALLGGLHALGALEGEWLGHHRDRENAERARYLGDDGRCASAGAAAHAGGDEHHVRAGDCLLQALALGDRDRPRFLGPGARPEPARAELDLVARLVARQHLRVGIDGDELDALHALLDHVIDGVAARAADSDHLDDRPCCLAVYDLEHVVFSLPLGHQKFL